jgi:hypothetical protein
MAPKGLAAAEACPKSAAYRHDTRRGRHSVSIGSSRHLTMTASAKVRWRMISPCCTADAIGHVILDAPEQQLKNVLPLSRAE